MTTSAHLMVSEIFHSIQGESSFAGWPCTFIRLAGCGHGCRDCDTGYAETGGVRLPVEEVIRKALAFKAHCIEITGGEPLLQPAVYPLMQELCDRGERVLLETGGFLPVDEVDPRVCKIIDIKPPSSGVSEFNCSSVVECALQASATGRKHFEFKFVLADRDDYLWARAFIDGNGLAGSCTVIFGPVFGKLEPLQLARWILEDRLPVRMQLQLHKYIWPPEMKGV